MTGNTVLWWALLVLISILVSREMVQLVANVAQHIITKKSKNQSPKNQKITKIYNAFRICKQHFSGVENFVEAWMFALACTMLTDPCKHTELKRYFAAVMILLSWSVLMTMVGRYPRLSRFNKYLTMYYKVEYHLLYLTRYIPQRQV